MSLSDRDLVASSLWTGEADRDRVFHHADLSEQERRVLHGSATVQMPAHVIAGASVDVAFHFCLGTTQLPVGAGLRIAWRWPFDWSAPQMQDSKAPNFLEVSSPDHCVLVSDFARGGGLNPWQHHIDLRVTDGTLRQGDVVEVHVANWEAPTFRTQEAYFVLLISPEGNDQWSRLVDAPRFEIHSGSVDRLVAIAPGDGVVGERAILRVRAIDGWENAVLVDAPHVEVIGADIGQPVPCDRYPVWEIPVVWTTPGVYRVQVRIGDHVVESNPTRVHAQAPNHRVFWGDLHGGQSEIGCGAGSLDHHYAYARDVAGLQFTSQQANDHYITAELWKHVRNVTPRHDSSDFLAYLGCEWSPYTEDGGDRNVIYLSDEERLNRSDRFFAELEPDPTPDLRRAPEFLGALRSRDVLLNLHVGGRPTNLEFHEPGIEPLFEVHSTHATSEWFLFDALSRGYKVGVTAGTDGVMGRPGACGPGRRVTRNVRNGLTAVTAEDLTQRAVATGFFRRHCYGTTGARLLLDVVVNDAPMGSQITTAEEVQIHVTVEGTAAIERIDFFCGTEIISSQTMAEADAQRLRLLWGGAREIGTAAAQRQSWKGSLELSEGVIHDVMDVGLQSPKDEITHLDQRVTFNCATAGNDMGFSFEAEGSSEAICRVVTELGDADTPLSQLRQETMVIDAGGVNRRIELGPAPSENSAMSVEATFEHLEPPTGEHAYWVRVTQIDRHRAWSSPVYATVKGDRS